MPIHELLADSWGIKAKTIHSAELLQTSLVNADFSAICVEDNGFVDTVRRAYNGHHHLVIRPDDVWIAILGQFNFYVNAHVEELRNQFVAHEEKQKLTVSAIGTRYTVNFEHLANQMSNLIHDNVVDKHLKNWILPDFTTTTHSDTVICSVLTMSTLKAYFKYEVLLLCGIPSVTLEGEKEDWEKLLARLDKLSDFGAEPAAWAKLLRPILSRFVNAFEGEPDIDFWGRVCHFHFGGSGPSYLSGWITAFCVWNSQGKWQGPALSVPTEDVSWIEKEYDIRQLELDGIKYPIIDDNHVPVAFCEVDVELNDNGDIVECMMVSGHLASIAEGDRKDIIRPLPSWFIFVKGEGEDPRSLRRRKKA
ncbi:hypothetical protein GALMADRAFT_142669 [Galerina marginata CBS 339.88]|uniref:DUF4419 domain-containing protein n=1 Tax=Galerina marginata (strain CBS 339.88) TaxID=685588 RepID=A0A067T1V6_GALM3|nr:hypothetical protein GALMADRAFT_142669 [Galerina marginata CBS 339.88]